MTIYTSVDSRTNPSTFAGRLYALAVLLFAMLASASALFGASAPAAAQGLALAVVPGVADGVTDQEWADIVEESAFLVEDFGLYSVNRYYEMEAIVGPDLAASVLACGPDVRASRESGAHTMGCSCRLSTGRCRERNGERRGHGGYGCTG
jgi:hypothetical protein